MFFTHTPRNKFCIIRQGAYHNSRKSLININKKFVRLLILYILGLLLFKLIYNYLFYRFLCNNNFTIKSFYYTIFLRFLTWILRFSFNSEISPLLKYLDRCCFLCRIKKFRVQKVVLTTVFEQFYVFFCFMIFLIY